MSRLIATLFGVGYLRPAPGTWGSLAALPLALALHWIGGPIALIVGLVVVVVVGHWAITEENAQSGVHDASEIVIDEVAGQWIALLPVSYGAAYAGVEVTALWPGWVAAFLSFRLFDIWKPLMVGQADRRGTPWSVMADDLWAGLFAALVTSALAILAHVVFV